MLKFHLMASTPSVHPLRAKLIRIRMVRSLMVMGILLFCAGLAIDFAVKKFNKSAYRILAVAVIVLAFLLIWAELAVGIFGTPFGGS